jgi:hypothetical protein
MPDLRPLTDEEAAEALASAMHSYGGRPLSREADLYLATFAAEALVERLWRAGVVLASRPT